MSNQAVCPRCKKSFVTSDAARGPTICSECQQTILVHHKAVADSSPSTSLFANRYELQGKPLGEGSFGIVYRAFDHVMKRNVAVKKLKLMTFEGNESIKELVIARFLNEADVLATVTHPSVIPVLDRGQFDGSYYIVFPLIAGKPLADIIPRGGFENPRRAVELTIKLLRALHYVYARHKILHRDVKPANMMVVDGDEDALYLMDFGLAALHDMDRVRLTATGTQMGTPAYMPPEQAEGDIERICHPSDLYSAGSVLFHLLTGCLPFTKPFPGVLMEIMNKPPPAPSQLRADLDPALDAIVLKALTKRPEQRWQTGLEFEAALKGWLETPSSRSAIGRVKEKSMAAAPASTSFQPGEPLPILEPSPIAVQAPPSSKAEGDKVSAPSTLGPAAPKAKTEPGMAALPPRVTKVPAKAPTQFQPAGRKPGGVRSLVYLTLSALLWLGAAGVWGRWASGLFVSSKGERQKWSGLPPEDATQKTWAMVLGAALLAALLVWLFCAFRRFRLNGNGDK